MNGCKTGLRTEYTDSYTWQEFYLSERINRFPCAETICNSECQCPSQAYDGKGFECSSTPTQYYDGNCETNGHSENINNDQAQNLVSKEFSSIEREKRIKKNKFGTYIDPFQKNIATTSGRRFTYDSSYPSVIRDSKWSSALVDVPGPYSFRTPLNEKPQMPWSKKVQWNIYGEKAEWPTELWKNWTSAATGPKYTNGGYSDQTLYSQFKVPLTKRSI